MRKIIIISIIVIAIVVAAYFFYQKKKEDESAIKSDSDKSSDAATKEQAQKVSVKPQLASDKIVVALDNLANPVVKFKEADAYKAVMGIIMAFKNRADYNAVNTLFRERRSGKLQTKRTLLNAIMSDLPNYKAQFEKEFTRMGLIKDSGGTWSYGL